MRQSDLKKWAIAMLVPGSDKEKEYITFLLGKYKNIQNEKRKSSIDHDPPSRIENR